MNITRPNDWHQPAWHADFGDATLEFEHLQKLAIITQDSVPEISICLKMPEPGLMFLEIVNSRQQIAEVYSLSIDAVEQRRRFGLFFGIDSNVEDEQYTESTASAVDLLKKFAAN